MTEVLRPSLETTPGFTCRARLNDWPSTNEMGHTSAPCLVQALVVRRLCFAQPKDAHYFPRLTNKSSSRSRSGDKKTGPILLSETIAPLPNSLMYHSVSGVGRSGSATNSTLPELPK